MDAAAAARAVVALEDALRDEPPRGSTRHKKDRARLSGALSVWEALTGLPAGDALAEARRVAGAVNPEPEWHYVGGLGMVAVPRTGDALGELPLDERIRNGV